MLKKIDNLLVILCSLVAPICHASELTVLDESGFPGRYVLELMGDAKTGDFARPIDDSDNTDAIISFLTPGRSEGSRARSVEYTGDNCGNGVCFAMYYYKAYHGIVDLHTASALVFDVKVNKQPSEPFVIRVGGYPSRAEVEVNSYLPSEAGGWKTVSIPREAFEGNVFEQFEFSYVEDVVSFGTTGSAQLVFANIRWEQQ